MKKITTFLFSLLMLLSFSWGGVMGQTTIAEQDFDTQTSWGYSSSVPFFNDDWGTAYLGIIDISSASPLDKLEFSSNILAENDLNSSNGTTGFADITFSEIDITSYSNVEITFDYQIKGYNASTDDARYEVFHDGVGQGQVDLHDGATDPDDTEGSITIAVPNTVDDVQLVISIRNNGQTGYSGFDNFLLAESSIKSEPSNHVSGFTATSTSIEKVDLSWTDASSGTTPDTYLILSNTSGIFTAPTNGNAQLDDTDLSDGDGVLNISQGTGSASFSGLNSNTQYYFEIYPYTNTGSNINYKTDGTVPSDNASTLEAPDLVLNEILADPADGADPNGDGTPDTDEDEFLEFVNIGDVDLDISGWEIEDSQFVRYTFEEGTILKPLQAIVIFDDGNPDGDFGNAIVKTAGELGLNNSDEQITVKDDQGNTLILITYPFEADQSIVRSPDLTGDFTDHETADTDDASSFSPGTRIDGTYFQPSTVITGSAGWRLLSLPVEDGTVSDISDNTAVQGVPGGDNSGADPNFFYNPAYDGTDQSDYLVPTNTTTPWGDGLGFFLYFFDNSTAGSSPLPLTLDAFGNAPDADVNVTVSDEWTLAGNPFNSNLSIDDISGNDSGEGVNDGLVSPIYLYDSSGWITVNLGSSNVIGDWSGFFVQRSGSSTTQLTIPASAATSDTVKLSKTRSNESFRQLNLLLEAPGNYSDRTNKLYFSDQSTVGRDGFDGGKLTPMDGSPYLAFENDFGNGKELFVQDSRTLNPTVEQYYELGIGGAGISGSYTMSWPEMINMPEDWEFTLNDYVTGASVVMIPGTSYEFEVEATQKRKETKGFQFSMAQAKSADVKSRFSITLKTSITTGTEEVDEPQIFALEQNYPNPFNPSTQIQYSVTESGPVSLTIYNVMGQKIATLVSENKSAGTYRVNWDAASNASGIYYYRLQAGNQVLTRQMTLIK